MKAHISNLVELCEENQALLSQMILMMMWVNGFRVDGVEICFESEE